MAKESIAPTRVCSICGLTKPLSAYMQMSGLKGGGYSTICSTCRGAGLTQKSAEPTPKEDETTSGKQIDKNTRVHAEITKEKLIQEQKESTRQDLLKREQLSKDKLARKDTIEKAERVHRDSFLKKPENFLSKLAQTKPTDIGKVAEANAASQNFLSEQVRQLETQKQGAETEVQNTSIDMNVPIIDPGMKKNLFDSDAMKRFAALLGNAPMMRNFRMYVERRQETQSNVAANNPSSEQNQHHDPLLDYIDKNSGPSRRR